MTKPFLVSLLLLWMLPGVAQSVEEATSPVVAEVRDSLSKYVEAFNRADAEALAGFWVEDATYITPTGEAIVGREGIRDSFRETFANHAGIKMEIADSVVVPATEGWAHESGTDILTYADGTVEESAYEALLKKVGESWLIQSVVDLGSDNPPSHYEYLKDLEWLIGSWRDEGAGMIVETTYEWSSKGNSILGKFAIVSEGEVEKDGLIVIAWDPIDQNIRSWTFDSEGGTAEGSWYEKDGKWFSKTLHVLPDGETGSSTRVFQLVDKNSLHWKAVNRMVDGEMLPNIGPVTLTRVNREGEESK